MYIQAHGFGNRRREIQDEGRAVLGPGLRDDKAVVILGRIVEWTSHGINYEGGPRHAELILKEMGITCKGSGVVGRAGDAEEGERELSYEESRTLRSLAARCNF